MALFLSLEVSVGPARQCLNTSLGVTAGLANRLTTGFEDTTLVDLYDSADSRGNCVILEHVFNIESEPDVRESVVNVTQLLKLSAAAGAYYAIR